MLDGVIVVYGIAPKLTSQKCVFRYLSDHGCVAIPQVKLDERIWEIDLVQRDQRVIAYIREGLKGSAGGSQDGIRTESAEVPEFRFDSFEGGAVGVGALPERKELLVLPASF